MLMKELKSNELGLRKIHDKIKSNEWKQRENSN